MLFGRKGQQQEDLGIDVMSPFGTAKLDEGPFQVVPRLEGRQRFSSNFFDSPLLSLAIPNGLLSQGYFQGQHMKTRIYRPTSGKVINYVPRYTYYTLRSYRALEGVPYATCVISMSTMK